MTPTKQAVADPTSLNLAVQILLKGLHRARQAGRNASRTLFQDDRLPYLAHHHGHHVGVDLGGIVALKPIECSEDLSITLPLLPHLLDQKADHFNRRGGGVL